MALGIITTAGRILMAKLLKGEPGITGLTHLAVGDGDGTFTDPLNPPANTIGQTTLVHERARKDAHRSAFLEPAPSGGPADVIVDGQGFNETTTPTNTIGVYFRLEEDEANGITIKEYGIFGGDVAYRPGVTGALAIDGEYDATLNPTGEVATRGLLFEVKNIPDFHKTPDTRFELVGIVTL